MLNTGNNQITQQPDWSHLTNEDRAVLNNYFDQHPEMTPEILAMMLSKFAGGYSFDEFIDDLRADEIDAVQTQLPKTDE